MNGYLKGFHEIKTVGVMLFTALHLVTKLFEDDNPPGLETQSFHSQCPGYTSAP